MSEIYSDPEQLKRYREERREAILAHLLPLLSTYFKAMVIGKSMTSQEKEMMEMVEELRLGE